MNRAKAAKIDNEEDMNIYYMHIFLNNSILDTEKHTQSVFLINTLEKQTGNSIELTVIWKNLIYPFGGHMITFTKTDYFIRKSLLNYLTFTYSV